MRGWRRAFGGNARKPRDADVAMRRALLAVLDHDFGGAESLLAEAVRRDSKASEGYLALASLYRSRGEIGRAIHMHQNLLLRSDLSRSARFEALLGLAEDFRQGGFLRRAIAAFEEALAVGKGDPRALRALVRLHMDARHHHRALRLARRLARIEGRDAAPVESALWVEVAEAARAEGRTTEAARALRRALRRDARSVRAWTELGELEAERGRTRRALAAWKRVPELDRRAGAAVYERVEAGYAAIERLVEHEAWLRRLVAQAPDDPEARLALARALLARGQSDEALAEVRRVIEGRPDHLGAHALRGRILLAERRELEAAKAYAELLEALDRRVRTPRAEGLE